MPDFLRRAIRVVLQLIVSGGLTAMVNTYANGLTPEQTVFVLAGWQVLVTAAHNALEDYTKFPAVLKAPPSPGVNPVPDPAPDAGLSDFVVVAVIACVALLLVVLLITGTITPR